MGDERESEPKVSIDFDPDEAISEAIRSIGEEMTKAAKELAVTENSLEESLSEVDKTAEEIIKELEEEKMSKPISEGDYVVAKMTDGGELNGRVIHYPEDTNASSYSLPSGQSLVQYWQKENYNILPEEDVYEVEMLDGGSRYAFPESKVWLHIQSLPLGLSGEEMDQLGNAGINTAGEVDETPELKLAEITNKHLARELKASLEKVKESADRDDQDEECPTCEKTFSSEGSAVVEGDEGELYCSIDCLNESYS
jgi:coenzyme F420-reducing hydrogenase alpha subunit